METNTYNTASESEALFSVFDVLYTLRQHWLIGLAASAICSISIVLFLSTRTPQFTAQASIVVELDTENIIDVGEVVKSGIKNSNLMVSYMNTHIDRLSSRLMARAVFEALDPVLKKRFTESYSGPVKDFELGEVPLDGSALLYKHALDVSWGQESQSIMIEITHSDPLVCQAIANQYVAQYIQYQAVDRSKSTSDAVSFLTQQVEQLRQELSAAELDLQAYRRSKNIVNEARIESIIAQNLEQWNQAITAARVRLLVADTRLIQIEQADRDLERLMNIPYVGGRESIQLIYAQLQELTREFKVHDRVYLENHPKVVENRASFQAVTDSLWRAIGQASKEVLVDQATISGELKKLELGMNKTREKALNTENDLIQYRVLNHLVNTLRSTYESLSSRLTETTIAERMNLNTIRALDEARIPSKPIWPDPRKIVLAAGFAGGIIFLGVPILISFFDGRIKNFFDIENYIGKPVLGHVLEHAGQSSATLARAVLNQEEQLLEPFRSIYGSLRLRLRLKLNDSACSLVVTSSMSTEGKSFIASNLAAIFARHKYRVLLVDCDLRRPVLHHDFDQVNERGLWQWVEQSHARAPTRHAWQHPELGIVSLIDQLDLLPSGGQCDSPTEILGAPRFKDLMQALQSSYDLIVYDTPPLGLFPDATLLSDHATATVFVARQNLVTRKKVRYAVSVMEQTSAPVIGVVFNRIKDVKNVVGYGQFGRSYYGYGFEKNASQYKKYYKQTRN